MRTIDGFAALNDCKLEIDGLVTYIIRGNTCEIVSLNSTHPNRGMGSALIETVKQYAISLGCEKLRLLTTNDNLNAIEFYHKRGFEVIGINIGAIDREHEIKPEIPSIGENRIPLHHEIDF